MRRDRSSRLRALMVLWPSLLNVLHAAATSAGSSAGAAEAVAVGPGNAPRTGDGHGSSTPDRFVGRPSAGSRPIGWEAPAPDAAASRSSARADVVALVVVGLVLAIAIGVAAVRFLIPIPADVGILTEAAVANILAGAAGAIFAVGIIVYRGGYLAGLWVSSPLVPGAAAVATVVSYLIMGVSTGVPYLSVAIGLTATGLGWSLAGFLCQGLARREVADMGTFDSLRDRFGQLCARYNELERASSVPASRQAQYETAISEARFFLESARRELYDPTLGRPSLRWIMGTGYGAVRRMLHRAEEIIIVAEPREAVVGDAQHDHLSLAGSTIAGRDSLSLRLEAAIRLISPDAARTFFGSTATADDSATSRPTEEEAREVLREVRFAVNTFRDARTDGLIRARNRLVWTMLAVGITSYIALASAILLQVSLTNLVAGIAFYLVAAIVGLFNRLRIESGRGSATEDHGLYLIRLVTAPLLSGIAGVAGVFVVAAAAVLTTQATSDPAGTALTTTDVGQLVANTYDLGKSQLSLITAAVFGFAPAQLASALQKQTERFQRDLEKSEPSGGAAADPTAD